MLDLLQHQRVRLLARVAIIGVLGVSTITAVAQYRQTSLASYDLPLSNLALPLSNLALTSPGPVEELLSVELPDFQSYDDVESRKEAFFEFLSPYVKEENARIA